MNTEPYLMRFALSLFWRFTIYGFVLGVVIGAFAGFFLASVGHADFMTRQPALFQFLVGLPATFIASFLCIHGLLKSDYSNFQLTIQPKNKIESEF